MRNEYLWLVAAVIATLIGGWLSQAPSDDLACTPRAELAHVEHDRCECGRYTLAAGQAADTLPDVRELRLVPIRHTRTSCAPIPGWAP